MSVKKHFAIKRMDEKCLNQFIVRKIVVCTLVFVFLLIGLLQIGLNIDVHTVNGANFAQLFFDWGTGYSEANSSRSEYQNGDVSLKIKLGGTSLKAIRFDPVDIPGEFAITDLKIRFLGIPLKHYSGADLYSFLKAENFEAIQYENTLLIESPHTDPVASVDPELSNSIFRLLVMSVLFLAVLAAVISYVFLYKLLSTKAGDALWSFGEKHLYWCRNKWASLCAVIHFFVCFWFQHIAFDFNIPDKRKIIICQFLFFVLLQILWQVGFHIISQLKRGNKRIKSFLVYSGIYFCVMLFMLLLTWPGYFVIDEWVMIRDASQWQMLSDYHFLMMLELILGMMLIPSTVGMEVIQILLISAVVGYAFMELSVRIQKKYWVWICFIPMLFPGILLNNLMLQRAIPSGYVEIFLLTRILCAYLDRRRISVTDAMAWAVLAAVCYTTRLDGSYYIILAPIVVIILFWKFASKQCLAFFCAATFALCCTFNAIQYDENSQSFYTALNFTRMGYAVMKAADPVKDAKELEAIGKLFDIEKYRAQTGVDEAMSTVNPKAYQANSQDVANYRNAVISLIIKHPVEHLLQQVEVFMLSSGFKYFYGDRGAFLGENASNNYQSCGDMFDPEYEEIYPYNQTDLLETIYKNPLNQPINQQLRKATIHFCMGRSIADFNEVKVTSAIFGNLILPVLALGVMWISLLARKKYGVALLLMLFLMRIPIIFLTSPYATISYWVRFLVAGSAVPFWLTAIYFGKPKRSTTQAEDLSNCGRE